MKGTKYTTRAVMVKLLDHSRHDRGMELAEWQSRCVRRGEIHELVTTDQTEAVAGERIDRVGFIGFAETLNAGVVEVGDEVLVHGAVIGRVIGFDECHFPNHYNVLVAVDALKTSNDLSVRVGDEVEFRERAADEERNWEVG